MEIKYKKILTSFLEIIDGFSDKEYQKRAWIKGDEADFDENVCLFFDLGDPIANNYTDYGITDHQYDLLVKFRSAFLKFSKSHSFPQEFIHTPEWGKIMAMAKEVLKAFNYQKAAPFS